MILTPESYNFNFFLRDQKISFSAKDKSFHTDLKFSGFCFRNRNFLFTPIMIQSLGKLRGGKINKYRASNIDINKKQ